LGLGCPWGIALGAPASEPFPESVAERYGLKRGWFTQLQIDPARGQLKDMILDRGTLFTLSNQSMLAAVDAATGETRWSVEVGNREHATLTPAVNRKFVAVINGSTLHVLNRYNGQLLWKKQLQAAVGAGAAVSQWRIYIPLLDSRLVCYQMVPVKEWQDEIAKRAALKPEGQSPGEFSGMESLRLEQEVRPPMSISSPGKAILPPLVVRQNLAEEEVIWATDTGYLCCGRIDLNNDREFVLRYRLKTDGRIAGPPCYLPPDANVAPDSGIIFATSEDGYVYAIRQREGSQLWRFSTGEPIIESPVVLGPYVFVTNQLGGLTCLHAKTGELAWPTPAPDVTRFLAASRERIYATDKLGMLRVLSATTGSQLNAIATETFPIKFTNTETDRLFLGSKTGMLACIYEPKYTEPDVRHIPAKEYDKPLKPVKAEQEEPETPKPTAKPSSTPKSSAAPKSSGAKSGAAKTEKKAAKPKKGAGDFGAGGTGKKGKRGKGGGAMPGGMPGVIKQPGAN
jgi:hypothetical protein